MFSLCGATTTDESHGSRAEAAQRVEIADGPAVRRARALVQYALHFGLNEAVADARCAAVARKAGYTTWTTDIVTVDAQRELREPIACIAAAGSHVNSANVKDIEAAWAAVTDAAESGSAAATRRMQECIEAMPVEATRAAAALASAASAPATYSWQPGGTVHPDGGL
eukprot:TRINITY_DN14510_c0_g1_i4.p2 TRINITY_DN14510_c0_g1~~TRINITY_DN14510_c0_g1_i4.p2  ORF type:complete len:168 (+),score=14.63 TRINITY_DN14510_c0_g1_i4:220-723(+)